MRLPSSAAASALLILAATTALSADENPPSNARVLDALNATEWIYELDSARIDATIRTTRPPETVELNKRQFVKQLRDIGVTVTDDIPDEIAQEKESFRTSSESSLTLAWDRRRLVHRFETPGCFRDITIWDGLVGRAQQKWGTRQNGFSLHPQPPNTVETFFIWLPWASTAHHFCPLQVNADHIRKLAADRAQYRTDESELRFHSIVEFAGTECELYARPTTGSWNRLYVEPSTGRLLGMRIGSWLEVTNKIALPVLQQALATRGIEVASMEEAQAAVKELPDNQQQEFMGKVRQQLDEVYWDHVPEFDPIWTVVLSDWREVLPGRWFPFRQENQTHAGDPRQRTGEALSVATIDRFDVNQPLDPDLFELTIDEGADVYDATHDPPLNYKQDSNRSPAEWAAIIAKAVESHADIKAEREALDALIGTQAPAFPETTWLNSEPLTWKQLAGKYVLVDFWHVGCGPCWNYLSWLQTIHESRDTDNGIAAISIHGEGVEPDVIQTEIAERLKNKVTFPICIDVPLDGEPEFETYPSELFHSFRVRRMPYAWLIGPDGKLVAHGDLPAMHDKARDLIRSSSSK